MLHIPLFPLLIYILLWMNQKNPNKSNYVLYFPAGSILWKDHFDNGTVENEAVTQKISKKLHIKYFFNHCVLHNTEYSELYHLHLVNPIYEYERLQRYWFLKHPSDARVNQDWYTDSLLTHMRAWYSFSISMVNHR